MKNEDIARVFGEIADLLELGDDNAYRVIAYRNAERELRSTGYDLPALIAANEALPKMPGIGPSSRPRSARSARPGRARRWRSCVRITRRGSSICCGCPG